MPRKMKPGTCANCGAHTKIKAKGLCSGCYARQYRGDQNVDCFALDVHSRIAPCRVMYGNCLAQKGKPCPFHRTKEEYGKSRARAIARIKQLPMEQQVHIVETYLMQKEGEE